MYTLAINIPEKFTENDVSCMIDGKYVHLRRQQIGVSSAPAHFEDIGYSSFILRDDKVTYASKSTIGLMVKLKGSLDKTEVKGVSLCLSALVGNNVYLNFK